MAIQTPSTSSSTRTSRHLSLPTVYASSPFVLASESPSDVFDRWCSEVFPSCPTSPSTHSPGEQVTPGVVATAYRAPRSTADFVRVLDLAMPTVPNPSFLPAGSTTARDAMDQSRNTEKDEIGRPVKEASMYSGAFENPRPSPVPPMVPLPQSPMSPFAQQVTTGLALAGSSVGSPTSTHGQARSTPQTPPVSPLTRENMARLKGSSKTFTPRSTADEARARARDVELRLTAEQLDAVIPRLGSPIRFDKMLETFPTPPSARQSPSARTTPSPPAPAATLSSSIAPMVAPHATRMSMFSDSTIATLNTADFDMPLGTGKARSDAYIFPHHGPRSRAAMERDSANVADLLLPPPAGSPRQSGKQRQAVGESFMNLNCGSVSTTFKFPSSAPPTISRMSIATDASSAYAPSMAAPSSIVRRTAAWAKSGTKAETVTEVDENELEEPLPTAAPLIVKRRNPPPPPLKHSRVSDLSGGLRDRSTSLSPETDSPTRTGSSGDRQSQISGDTFGARRRRWSISTPIEEDGDANGDEADLARSGYASDGEGRIDAAARARHAPSHLAAPARSTISTARQSASRGETTSAAVVEGERMSLPHRNSHRKPETDEEITTYLLRAASKNHSRIIPAGKAARDPTTTLPPTSGTRLKGLSEDIKEDESDQDDSDVDDDGPDLGMTPRTPKSTRIVSKVDQILGRGALEAGQAMGHERRVLHEALERTVISSNSSPDSPNSLPPPLRPQHKASASVPAISMSPRKALPHAAYLDSTAARGSPYMMDQSPAWTPFTHTRNVSLDSVWSHNPSLADSVTRLLPSSPRVEHFQTNGSPSTRYIGHHARGVSEQVLGPERDDMTPEQRQALRRRAKVLEKRLGVPLRADQRGQWVIKPPVEHLSSSSDSGHKLDNSALMLASKAKAAFTRDKRDFEKPYNVENQMRIGDPDRRPMRRSSEELSAVATLSPASSRGSRGTVEDEDDQLARAQRVRQMAKLNKILGIVVTPDKLESNPDLQATHPHASASPGDFRPAVSPIRHPDAYSDQVSFMSFDDDDDDDDHRPRSSDGSRWTSKIRLGMGQRSSSAKEMPKLSSGPRPPASHGSVHDQSFLDIKQGGSTWRTYRPGSSSPVDMSRSASANGHNHTTQGDKSSSKMSAAEGGDLERSKTWARRSKGKATVQVPETTTTITELLDPVDPIEGIDGNASIDSWLRQLLYLVEHDTEQLSTFIDAIAADKDTAQSLSAHFAISHLPRCPSDDADPCLDRDADLDLDVDVDGAASHAALRRRHDKLGQFFGETRDFTRPPSPMPEPRSALAIVETALSDAWRTNQVERRRGKLRGDEMERFGEVVRALRRRV